MPDTDTQPDQTDDTEPDQPDDQQPDDTEVEQDQGDPDQLGDPGRRALQAEREARRQAEQQAQQLNERWEQFTAGIASALGLDEDSDGDPEALQEQLGGLQAENRQLRVENRLHRVAVRRGANPVTLTDSRSFMERAAQLDPESDDFDEQLGELVDEAVKADPRFAGTQTAGASDAGASNPPASETDMNDLLRQAVRGG